MAKASYASLKLDVRDRRATVTLARPEMRNAFDPGMIRELTEVFADLSARDDLSVIVLRGEGKSFCSGADLNYMKSMAAYTLEENQRDAQALHGMFWTLRGCPHPILGRVHGHVMGGGMGLVAVCDIAAAVDDTRFCFSEVKLGLAPAVISPFVLERMHRSHACRYMLTAEVFNAAEALESGLVHHRGSELDVDQFVEKMASIISGNGSEAVRATKNLLRACGEIDGWKGKSELAKKTIIERRLSSEGQEGLRSFLEKRAPKWMPKWSPK